MEIWFLGHIAQPYPGVAIGYINGWLHLCLEKPLANWMTLCPAIDHFKDIFPSFVVNGVSYGHCHMTTNIPHRRLVYSTIVDKLSSSSLGWGLGAIWFSDFISATTACEHWTRCGMPGKQRDLGFSTLSGYLRPCEKSCSSQHYRFTGNNWKDTVPSESFKKQHSFHIDPLSPRYCWETVWRFRAELTTRRNSYKTTTARSEHLQAKGYR